MPQIDWINALAAQDQSFESQLAQRDLTKKLALLQSVKQTQIENQQRTEEFGMRREDTQARMAETKRLADERIQERKTSENRLRYNTERDNMKPGDRFSKTRDAEMLTRHSEFDGGSQFSDDPTDPDSKVYRAADWKQAQLDHTNKVEKDKEDRARAKEDQTMQKEGLQMQRDAAKRAEQANQRAQGAFDQRVKGLETKQKELGPQGWQIAHARANERLKLMEKTPGWFDDSDQLGNKRASVIDEEVEKELTKKRALTGQAPPPAQAVHGISGDGYLTPEEVKTKFPNLPPGSRVRRVQ